MPKYRVYGVLSASVVVGEYEAETEEEAIEMANEDQDANWMPSLCHQCSREVALGDVYKAEAEEIE